jgi:hypothetical protein
MTEENIYQAIGVIRGKVSLEKTEEKEELYIEIKDKGEEKKYRVFYSKRNYKSFLALKLEMKNNPREELRLIVYPKVIHFPDRNKPYFLAFQLVGFSNETSNGVTSQLEDNMFVLTGKWQFIPCCKTPVVTIHKNFSKERVDYFKELEVEGKRKLAKASHVPLFWKDAIVNPFRFNPKVKREEQGKLYFVKIKARFLPSKDAFGFDSLIGIPTEEIPRFIKFKTKKKNPNKKKKKVITNKEKDAVKDKVAVTTTES